MSQLDYSKCTTGLIIVFCQRAGWQGQALQPLLMKSELFPVPLEMGWCEKSLQAEPSRCRINRMGWWGGLWWIIYLLSAVNSAFSLGSSHIAWEGTKFPFTKMIQLINGVSLKNTGHWCHTRNTHRQKSFFLWYQILCIFSWEGTVTKKFFIGPICLNDLHSLGLLKKFLHRKS